MLGIIRIKRSVDDQLHAYNITAYVVGQATVATIIYFCTRPQAAFAPMH